MSSIAMSNRNPIFMRHDLMIELGRLEMAIESARTQETARTMVERLESHCVKISEALSRLPA